jgi:hypothetical protein
MGPQRFTSELIEGHKGVVVVIVPFDPEDVWQQKPVRLAERRHGWLVKGTVNRVAFDGYVGERWGRFFVMLEERLRKAAGVGVGDEVRVVLTPTAARSAFEKAVEQSKRSTQPSKARADALDPGARWRSQTGRRP